MGTQRIAFDVCRSYLNVTKSFIPERLSSKIDGYLRSRNLDSLGSCTNLWEPSIDGSIERKWLMQIEAFFKKFSPLSDDERCTAAAQSAFLRAEKLCRITNRRLDYYYTKRDRLDPDLRYWLSRMEKDICAALGPFDSFLESLPARVKVTAGATAKNGRRYSRPFLRVKRGMWCTPACEPYVKGLAAYYGLPAPKCRITTANRVEFVPKNWKTHRTIACEPEGNMLLQLAFDDFCKSRLRRWKVDLGDQSWNQELAYRGSLDGSFATIDLSMASDTMSKNVVAWLLPDRYFRFLSNIRSRYYTGAVSGEYAKFSSMGNGATFSLETLIFCAAVRAVGSRVYAVYGDDLVIETEYAHDLMRLLRFLGFFPNEDKSYVTGPFRESCGRNWFLGEDITPFYLRELDSRKATWHLLINSLTPLCYPDDELGELLISYQRERQLTFTPYSDDMVGGIHLDAHTCWDLKVLSWDRKLQTSRYKALVPQSKRIDVSRFPSSLLLWHLDAWQGKRPRFFRNINDPVRESLFSGCVGEIVRSTDSLYLHRYKRQWVRFEPKNLMGTRGLHLSWWSQAWARAS